MPGLIKLTLSIRDTHDTIFCHGSKFESMLIEYLPNLREFDYTMTHRIDDGILTEEFNQWPMKFIYYENENSEWLHVFSLPWPSNKDDKRKLPFVKDTYNRSITSDVKLSGCIDDVMITKNNELIELKTRFRHVYGIRTSLPIDFKLPLTISKVILTKETRERILSRK